MTLHNYTKKQCNYLASPHLDSIHEYPFLLLYRQAHEIPGLLIQHAILVLGNAVIGIKVGLEEAGEKSERTFGRDDSKKNGKW
jgi:hypothetical protein